MEQIRLLTRWGEYVTTVTIPIFTPQAEVILWGTRYFVRRDDGKYYEGMCWPALSLENQDWQSPVEEGR